MNRLQSELQRLYLLPAAAAPALVVDGRVRALVLELAGSVGWGAMARVWQGVQVDLELPAPAIAVSGSGHYQLWFSLTQAIPVREAAGILDALRARYLPDVPPDRIVMHPGQAPAPGLPPAEVAPGRWSAFVATDLAALFADETWLDLPPSADAQADLLSRVKSTNTGDLQRAMQRASEPVASPRPEPAAAAPAEASLDPRRFLLETMNDRAVELHLRIEAAKALLPYFEGARAP
jgi:hypothetical protein